MRRALALLLPAAALVVAAPAAAQQPLQGRVEKAGAGVAGVEVTLHRVTREAAGALAAVTSGSDGAFEFTLPAPDTAGFTVYFATAEYLGVRYFGPPLHGGGASGRYAVQVYDTASLARGSPALPLRRDVVMIHDPTDSWEVNEVVTIRNPAERTLIAADGGATWSFPLPPDARDFQVGEGTIAGDRVVRMGDRVLIAAPLTPGAHEVLVRYRLPPGTSRVVLTAEAPVDTFRLFVRQPAPALSVVGLAADEMVAVEGERFLRYSGGLPAGAAVELAWRSGAPPVDPVHAAVGVVAALLVLGSVVAVRRRQPSGGAPPPADD